MNTKQLRQKILDLAIRGKLVQQDPKDEPASDLLERIKAEKEQLIKEGKLKRGKKTATSSDKPHYPFDLPKGWVWSTLGEVGTWQAGGTPSRSNKSYYGGEIPWLKTGDLNDGIVTDIPESITQEGLDNSSAKLNPKGSVLIAMYGATIGKIGILDFPATTNQACCACKDYQALLHQRYLFLFLLSHREEFISQGGGGAQPNISKEIIVKTPIPIPPLNEQERIVQEANKYLELIEALNDGTSELLNVISQIKRKLLELAISGKLVPQDPADEPAGKLLQRINPSAVPADKSHYQHLPNGWWCTSMNNVCQLTDGQRQVGSRINLDAKFLRGKSEGVCLDNGRFVAQGTTMILVDGENSGEIFTAPIDGYQGSTFKLLHISDEMNVEYVKLIIRIYQKRLRDNKVGSAIPHLNKKLFKAIEVPVPPINEQARIVEKVSTIFSQIDSLVECL